jgi:NAD(P)-dependent dehydrogenase (short-subunit alcohol dehydrogenase family)
MLDVYDRRLVVRGRAAVTSNGTTPDPATGAETLRSRSALFDLTDKVALVTGASRGLGRAIVEGFARAGADVVVTSRRAEACETVAHAIRASTGRDALAVGCHVGRWVDIDELIETVYGRFGRIDVLVNNAGMSPLYPDPASVSEELYDKVLDVNLKGPFRLTALVGTRMAADGGGSIINVSSTGSERPTGDIIPYSAAKAGLNAMTRAFADAFGSTVRVNCILPGAFETDITKAWTPDYVQMHRRMTAMGRMGHVEEIVGAALYFASDASSYTTGALLRVDGGGR